MKMASDTSVLERQREQLKQEAGREESEMKKFVDQNAHKAQDQAEYDRQYRARFAAYEQQLAIPCIAIENQRIIWYTEHENIWTER